MSRGKRKKAEVGKEREEEGELTQLLVSIGANDNTENRLGERETFVPFTCVHHHPRRKLSKETGVSPSLQEQPRRLW